MRNINIFVFSPRSLQNGRGGEISSIELATGLNKYFKVSLYDTNRIIEKEFFSKKTIREKIQGLEGYDTIKFYNFRLLGFRFDFPHPREIFRLLKIIRKFDIIYYSLSKFQLDLLFVFFSLIHRKGNFIVGYRKPLYSSKILSIYNLRYRTSILLYSLKKKRFYHHTLSIHAKKFLCNFYPNQIIRNIVHGIDIKKYKDSNIAFKDKNILNFVYIGYLDDIHKGIGVLLDSIELFIREFKNLKIHFDFCGMGPLAGAVKNLELKYPEYVTYHGYINNEEVNTYFFKNDVYLFTSRREPFPRVLMEAMASEELALCTKTIGSIELLKNKTFAFFIDKLEKKLIKDKLIEIYELWENEISKFRFLQKQAKTYITENFTIENEIEEFRELIENIMK